jgi:6-phosphogluconolactonase
MRFRRLAGAAAATGMLFALVPAAAGIAAADQGRGGFVYTETNSASGNAVLAFARNDDGRLHAIGTFPTHGSGTGTGLGTQGEVILAGDNHWLLAVNAGSNDVSVFRVRPDGRLALMDRAPAGGTEPVSVTAFGRFVYVLDAGGSGNIAGFWMDPLGRLHHLPGSVRSLSGPATSPAQVSFSTNGRFLVVTERATNSLDTYPVALDGVAGARVTTASSGPTPYGFAFDLRNHPIVSEATNSSLSSYRLSSAGATVISASVPTGGLAACWVVVTPDGRWAFDTNAHGGTISSFAIARNGAITLRASVAANTGAGSAPLDLGVSANGRFLYVNESASHRLMAYAIGPGASLTAVSNAPALPAGSSGLASF